ncbi:MAG: hypothetical protein VXV97_04410 [Pseudomonadota bacterium]|nr:hypothetical protein [Pseudomonadota bacterium]
MSDGRVEDALRSPNHHAHPVGPPAAVHVTVAHPPPLMGVSFLTHHITIVIDLGVAEVAHNIE